MKDDLPVKKSLLRRATIGFDGLKKREQNLLFVAIPATVVAVFFLMLIEPEINKAQRLNKSLAALESQMMLGKESSEELFKQASADPNATVTQQIDALQKRLAALNSEFEGELNQLVSPQAMQVLLEQLFSRANNLSLINMKSVAPQILMTNDLNNQSAQSDTSDKSVGQQPIFRHGIEITFEGSFFATRDFLAQAEGLGWKLYWQDLSYIVNEHPNAVTKMTLFTLSTSEAFIGVN